jgi:hypothetical protein
MFLRRTVVALMTVGLALAAAAPVAAARHGPTPSPSPSTPGDERPLTRDERIAATAKFAAAQAYVITAARLGHDLLPLGCVTPTGVIGGATIAGCSTPQGFVAVEARDQVLSHYCGPAVGQVIANYSWAMASGLNRFTQAKIAGWMLTDVNGSTAAPDMRTGLEKATAGSPRRPAGFAWVIGGLSDSDGDGQVGDELHAMVRFDISQAKMPLAIPVRPFDPDDQYHLSSWARPVASNGHWIAAYGWVGLWTGTDYALLYYTDSSRDEGGSTGKFNDPVRHIAQMIMDHTRRIVW